MVLALEATLTHEGIYGNGDVARDHIPDVTETTRYNNNVSYPGQLDTGASVNIRCKHLAIFKLRRNLHCLWARRLLARSQSSVRPKYSLDRKLFLASRIDLYLFTFYSNENSSRYAALHLSVAFSCA
jgi:hypothetical protein